MYVTVNVILCKYIYFYNQRIVIMLSNISYCIINYVLLQPKMLTTSSRLIHIFYVILFCKLHNISWSAIKVYTQFKQSVLGVCVY